MRERGAQMQGSPISLDLGWRELREDEFEALTAFLQEFGLTMLGVISVSLTTRRLLEAQDIKVIIGRLGLAQHQGRQRPGVQPPVEESPRETAEVPQPVAPAEVAPPPVEVPSVPGESAMVLRKTLRSGQRVDYDGTVVVLGDVNAGAHIEATGDILVMGSLRGMVHAGAQGRTASTVYALGLQAGLLRIAGVVGEVPLRTLRPGTCTQARLEGDRIVFVPLKL
jgi:septum site-determining protein MinC